VTGILAEKNVEFGRSARESLERGEMPSHQDTILPYVALLRDSVAKTEVQVVDAILKAFCRIKDMFAEGSEAALASIEEKLDVLQEHLATKDEPLNTPSIDSWLWGTKLGVGQNSGYFRAKKS